MNDTLRDMRYAGKVNLSAIRVGLSLATPGTKLSEIDAKVEEFIRQAGCIPAFKNYQPAGYPIPFKHAACISVNNAAVHGIPNDYKLMPEDILTIDLGTELNGQFVDAARAAVVSEKAPKIAHHLLEATGAILDAQLNVIKDQCSFLTLIQAAEKVADEYGVVISNQWGGHGIGSAIHLDPFVPNTISKKNSRLQQAVETTRYSRQCFEANKTYCIEPVVMHKDAATYIGEDGWTVYTKDGGLACHIEKCILVTECGVEILS